jgi:hypothetical protein
LKTRVLRVHLDRDLHVVVAGTPVDVGPVRHGQVHRYSRTSRYPLSQGLTIQFGQVAPGWPPGQPGHRHDPPDPQRAGDLHGPLQVRGVLLPHHRVRVQRIAVDVEPGQLDPVLGGDPQVVLACGGGGQHVVDRDVRGADEAADVDLGAGQPEFADHRQGRGQVPVVQDRGVDAQLHGAVLPGAHLSGARTGWCLDQPRCVARAGGTGSAGVERPDDG